MTISVARLQEYGADRIEPLLSTMEVVGVLGVSRRTVERIVSEGQLATIRVGGRGGGRAASGEASAGL